MMSYSLLSAALLHLLGGSAAPQPLANEPAPATVVFADAVYTASGTALSGGSVSFANGKIVAVAPGAPASDAVRVGAITPGMGGLSARVAGT